MHQSFEECLMALETPSFRSEDLNPEMAVIHLYHIKGRLQDLLEASLSLLNSTTGGDGAREEVLDNNIRAALELL